MHGTLRQRLLWLFLLVSLIPSLGLTLGVTFYLSRSIAALRNPETEQALAQSLEVIRQGIERLGSDARQHAEVMALEPSNRNLIASSRLADLERALRFEARNRGLDYVCLYRVGPPAVRIFGARLGPRITLPEPEPQSLSAALEQGGLITGGEGPRQVSGVAPFGSEYMILAGYQLDPEISNEIVALQKNLAMYRKLGVYTWLSQRGLWIFAILWTLILGVVSFVLAYFVARDTARPVLKLREAMERVSSGDLSHRVDPSGTQEVRFLGNAFNRMVEELQGSRRALVRAERLAAWREVARAVAHEIRNPLTPIQFALQRLKEEAGRPSPRGEIVQENAALILNEVHSLQEFVTSFSAVAQLPEPHFAPCDVGSLLEGAAKLYRGSSAAQFRVEIADRLPLAWADEAQIQRVLVNLIKNALEASADRGTVTLRAQLESPEAAREIRIEVEDEGRGMDPATLERAAAPGFTTKSSGSGLGLTLVQRIVEQHSGRFGLESNPGIGTRAWFVLPAAPERAAIDEAADRTEGSS